MEWIKCSHKLPEQGITVLGFSKEYGEGYVHLVLVDPYISANGTQVTFQNDEPRLSAMHVTHWMPIPLEPKS